MRTRAKFDRNGRRQYQHADRVVRRKLRQRQDDCGICHRSIDYSLRTPHPDSFEIDHVLPISLGGDKSMANSRAAHRHCNRQRSNKIDIDPLFAAEVARDARAAKQTAAAAECPPGPCEKCRGVHDPAPGVEFITARQWWPTPSADEPAPPAPAATD